MYKIVKQFKFAAAHMLLGYEGLCQHLHGHTFKVEVCIGSKTLDNLGMVIDFKILQKHLEGLLDRWDHSTLLNINESENLRNILGQRVLLFEGNPTAENLSKLVYDYSKIISFPSSSGIRIIWTKVWESDSAYAEYSEDE